MDSKVQIRIAQVFEDNLIEGPAARLLAIVLCWRMDDDDETTVTRKELADKIGSSAKTVSRHLNHLEDLGYITKDLHGGDGSNKNVYRAGRRWSMGP